MSQGGFIKLHRCALDSWLWQMPAEQFKVALTVLVSANWRNGVTVSGGRRVNVPRGSFVTTLDDLAAKSGVTVRTCRTALQNLQKLEFLTSTSTNRFRVISVMNYDSYQSRDDETDKQGVTQAAGKRQASDKQVTGKRQAHYKEEEREEVQEGKKSIPSAGADRLPSQPGLFAESAQEARESSVVHRDTGEDANAAPAPDGEPSERVGEWGRELRDVIAEDSSRRAWGRELAARRKRIGITANELAKYLSVSGRRLTAWEKGAAVPGPEEGAQCMERLGQIEARLAELAGAAVGALNRAAGSSYREDSQRAREAAREAWRQSWTWERVAAVVERICAELADYKGGTYLRPATVFQKQRLLDAAEQLDDGGVPHHERQPLKGAAFLDRIDEEIAAMRREDEQRRQLL